MAVAGTRTVRVWDLPTRLFHWALVLAVAACFVTAKAGEMEAHGIAGLSVLGLLVFRVAWGFAGSTHARFASFVRGPRAVRDYLQGRWHGLGHNPVGALSVLAFLAVLLAQAGSGLFASDDSLFQGPLAALASAGTVEQLSSLHRLQEPLLIALVVLHVAAMAWYRRVKRRDLVTPMFTGRAATDDPSARDAQGGGAVAFVLCVLLALGAVYAASGALIPPPPPVVEPVPPPPSW